MLNQQQKTLLQQFREILFSKGVDSTVPPCLKESLCKVSCDGVVSTHTIYIYCTLTIQNLNLTFSTHS